MQMNNFFSDRLKEERIRMDMNQEEFGEACGVKKLAQFNYEKGSRKPDSEYLQRASEMGVDVSYLITGTRTSEVEMTVVDKVTKVEKNAQATGNQAGADNLAQAVEDMVAGQIRRGENAQRRSDELRQIMYMLCDIDDEQFEKAYQAISDIHSQFSN